MIGRERCSGSELDAEVENVEAAGGTVAQAYLRMGAADAEIVDLARESSRGLGGITRALTHRKRH